MIGEKNNNRIPQNSPLNIMLLSIGKEEVILITLLSELGLRRQCPHLGISQPTLCPVPNIGKVPVRTVNQNVHLES